MPSRLEKTLQKDITEIRDKVIKMGSLAEQAVSNSLNALVEMNQEAAYAVILRDREIDELEKELDGLCLEFLVRQQPAGSHLRFVYSVIKINNELERVGDYAESVARQVLKLSEVEPQPSYEKFSDIANLSIPMLRNALLAFEEENPELAKSTLDLEKQVDAVRYEIHNELVTLRDERKMPSEVLPPLMIIASRFERVADQATNICEEVLYMCTGENIKHEGKDVVRILFVDERDSCRGQVAEGIANSLGVKGFKFSSAGLSPKPIDPQTIKFMAEKGIDISKQTSRYLHQTLNLGDYTAIVTLCKEAEEAFPPPPSKTVRIRWNIKDPSKATGSEEEIHTAYEKTYKYLDTHIRGLIQAISGENELSKKSKKRGG